MPDRFGRHMTTDDSHPGRVALCRGWGPADSAISVVPQTARTPFLLAGSRGFLWVFLCLAQLQQQTQGIAITRRFRQGIEGVSLGSDRLRIL